MSDSFFWRLLHKTLRDLGSQAETLSRALGFRVWGYTLKT